MENPEKVSLAAGVPPPSLGAGAAHASVLAPERTVCAICREEASSSTSLRLSSLACGHTYCDTCWGAWIESKVADGDTSVRCPGQACTLRVPEETVRALCSEATAERFAFLLRQSFVDEKCVFTAAAGRRLLTLALCAQARLHLVPGRRLQPGGGHERRGSVLLLRRWPLLLRRLQAAGGARARALRRRQEVAEEVRR